MSPSQSSKTESRSSDFYQHVPGLRPMANWKSPAMARPWETASTTSAAQTPSRCGITSLESEPVVSRAAARDARRTPEKSPGVYSPKASSPANRSRTLRDCLWRKSTSWHPKADRDHWRAGCPQLARPDMGLQVVRHIATLQHETEPHQSATKHRAAPGCQKRLPARRFAVSVRAHLTPQDKSAPRA